MVHLGKGVAWHENHQQSDNLRAVKLKTFRQNECDLIYGGNGDIKRQHLCAYYAGLITITGRGIFLKRQNSVHQSIQRFFFNAGRDACQGDSGGPLFAKRNKTKSRYELLQHEIVGITSVGRDCGLNGFPGKNLSILFFMYNYE